MMIKKAFLATIILCSLMIGAIFTASGQEAAPAVFVSQDDVKLTVYQNLALVQDVRTFELVEGLNVVAFVGVPPIFNATSVTLTSVTDPSGTRVLQQRFQDVQGFDFNRLLEQNVGETLTFVMRGEGDLTYEGVLRTTNPIIVQLADGSIVTLNASEIRQYKMPNQDLAMTDQPTLMLLVDSDQAGEQQLALSYLTNGFNWGTTYNLSLAENNQTLDITGWLTIQNNSGMNYDQAEVTLVAGDSNQLQFVTRDTNLAAAATATPTGTPTPYGTEEAYAGFGGDRAPIAPPDSSFIFTLPQSVSLPTNQSQLIEFLSGSNAEAQNIFVFDASPRVFGASGFITSPTYGITGIGVVQNYLEFSTGESGLNTALPSGLMRVFQDNLLLGETNFAYVPEGETVQVYLENARDVSGERRQIEFQILSNDAIQESYEIRLNNRRNEDITIVVPERMTRSINWEILASTEPFEQPNPFGIEYVIEVPAGEEVLFSYTVLYTRPQ